MDCCYACDSSASTRRGGCKTPGVTQDREVEPTTTRPPARRFAEQRAAGCSVRCSALLGPASSFERVEAIVPTYLHTIALKNTELRFSIASKPQDGRVSCKRRAEQDVPVAIASEEHGNDLTSFIGDRSATGSFVVRMTLM
jgi:hypothetical protein